jgi:ECF sigma factor
VRRLWLSSKGDAVARVPGRPILDPRGRRCGVLATLADWGLVLPALAARRARRGRPMTQQPQDVTGLLLARTGGDEQAFERRVPMVYEDLRWLAKKHMARERPGHLLRTTARAHEAYLRLIDARRVHWQNRRTSSPSRRGRCGSLWNPSERGGGRSQAAGPSRGRSRRPRRSLRSPSRTWTCCRWTAP